MSVIQSRDEGRLKIEFPIVLTQVKLETSSRSGSESTTYIAAGQ